MWLILVSLFIGIVIGVLRFIPEKYMKYNSRFQQAGIILLLFSMGASIGANKSLLSNLKIIGLKSASFAVLTCLFSIAAVYFTSRKFFGEGSKK
jgi:uncharacterized membrane protein YbjE (DUF340 family)